MTQLYSLLKEARRAYIATQRKLRANTDQENLTLKYELKMHIASITYYRHLIEQEKQHESTN